MDTPSAHSDTGTQSPLSLNEESEGAIESPERGNRFDLGREGREVLRQGWDALKMVLVLTILCGVVFPVIVYTVGQAAFNRQANGSLVMDNRGKIVGSELIGQQFARPEYFHGRPSAVGYNAASSGGSNLGPTNPQRIDGNGSTYAGIKSYADRFRAENKLPAGTELPSDIVTASGSGLDPHISVQAARLQVNRVVSARQATSAGAGISPEKVSELVTRHTEGRELGLLGTPRVNVLSLNMDLDATFGVPSSAQVPGEAEGR